jgi:solute carrier family 35 protein E3
MGPFYAYVAANTKTLALMALNVAGVVGIVIVMKQLFHQYGFRFPVFLLVLHQLATAVAMWVMKQNGALEPKKLERRAILQLAVGEIGSIVFSNLSLLQNSVGMYQIYKLLNIPFMCVFEAFWLKSTFSGAVKLSLLVLLGGIGLATVTDVQYNGLGLAYGLLAVLTTTTFQVQMKYVTKEKDLSGLQVADTTVLPKAALLSLLVPVLEKDPRGILTYAYDPWTVSLILTTCLLGIIATCTPAMIISRTTPVTFQVVGHAKTCLVIASGFVFFDQPVVAKNVAGLVLALAGMIWYSYLKMPPAAPKAKDAPPTPADADHTNNVEIVVLNRDK